MTVFSRIVVAVDFWRASAEAIAEGRAIDVEGEPYEIASSTQKSLELARALVGNAGSLRLFHVVPSLAYTAAYAGPEAPWMPGPTIREIDEKTAAHAAEVLTKLAEVLLPGVAVEVATACGHTIDQLLLEVQRAGADAIVVGTSGRSRAGRFFLGSTADKVIRQAPCPVVVVPTSAVD